MKMMNTYTNKQFDPLKINEADICLEDISHALSLLCRGGGHVKYFYSVAQHAINCMHEAKARNYPLKIQLACLLHDASEAYLSDIIRPVKMHLPEYYQIETMIMAKIFSKFKLANLDEKENSMWQQIDDDILQYELKYLINDKINQQLPPLSSKPDLLQKNWQDVEKEFNFYASDLLSRLRD